MKSLAIVLGALCVILLLPGVLGAITDLRSTTITAQYDVTTGGGVTTSSIVLAHALYGDDTISATVTSNNTADAPIPYSYVSSTKAITINGLNASDVRRLTIAYLTGSLSAYPGADIAAKMWPLFIILGVIGLIVVAIVSGARRGEE